MKILSCNSNIYLAESISKTLNTQLVKVDVKRFSDIEVFVAQEFLNFLNMYGYGILSRLQIPSFSGLKIQSIG